MIRIASRPKLYISGPMTGERDWNFPAFRSAAANLETLGYMVEDPSRHFNGATGLPWEVYMVKDIQLLMTECWGVVTLPGWQRSRGARLEVALARAQGLVLLEYVEGERPRRLDHNTVGEVIWDTASRTAESVSTTRAVWSVNP